MQRLSKDQSEVIGIDLYNQALTGNVSKSLNCAATDADHVPCVLIAYGVVTKGNGEIILSRERHTSLSTGGGQAGQGFPCVMIEKESSF